MAVRHVQALMGTTAMIIAFMLRVNMSVGVVVMTNKSKANPNFPEYKWSELEKSRILSSFYWGYMLLQIFVGKLAEKYGTKIILAIMMTLSAITTVIIPLFVPYGYLPVLTLRVIQGASQGAFIPCLTVLLSKWFSPIERSRALAIAISGGKIGTVLSFPLSGFLASSYGGWPSIFYITGGIAFVWVLMWVWLGASNPDCCRNISEKEKHYIKASMQDVSQEKLATPWRDIIKSKPMWAILITHTGHYWGYSLLLTQLPNYMNSVLGVDIKKNGILSSLPYLCAWAGTFLYSWIAVHIRTNYSISKSLLRKLFNSIGMWGCALGFLVLVLSNTRDVTLATSILVATVTLNSAIHLGFMTNHLDLSPNFCGTIMGLTNSLSSIASILAPLTVGWMVTDTHSKTEWNHVFLLTSSIMFSSNLIYLIFGSSDVQSWNSGRSSNPKN